MHTVGKCNFQNTKHSLRIIPVAALTNLTHRVCADSPFLVKHRVTLAWTTGHPSSSALTCSRGYTTCHLAKRMPVFKKSVLPNHLLSEKSVGRWEQEEAGGSEVEGRGKEVLRNFTLPFSIVQCPVFTLFPSVFAFFSGPS